MVLRGKRSAPVKNASSVSTERGAISEIFQRYSDGAEAGITPEGVERFCNDLDVDPTDRRILLLAWKMRAKRMGFFSRSEFEQGFKSLKATNLIQLKKALTTVETELKDPDIFQGFFEFAFKYCLTEELQKIIDLETAIQMLSIVLEGNPHLEPLLAYLQEQKDYKTINLDQWQGFGRFVLEVEPDYGNYDENQAWPLLLDNFVAWRLENVMQ